MADTSGEHPVDLLAEEFARRWRQGEEPSIEEYAARHPGLESEIRDVFPAVLVMEQMKPRREEAPGTAPAPPGANGTMPGRVGEYRIVREIGRGGMGIVYEAVQEPLGRHVAIKVLPAHLLANERLRQRFRREAQAAARLHHTNIVPVFGVGEQDGLGYYVMQLIAGRGLDGVLAEVLRARRSPAPPTLPAASDGEPLSSGGEAGPAAPPAPATEIHAGSAAAVISAAGSIRAYAREVARIGAQVADALDHAHGQGILHRDIKPSNLLLDERGAVWVTDFGVAKLVEEANLTQSGDLVGTLRYMPPERFHGESGPRGDVYSLGITLYEMLALRPAFPDTTPQHLIQLITHADLRPLRQVRPGVPADLETVLLKATARDPGHRYATAGELADDLRRFLDDRPIRARRVRTAEHLWRWCRRNPLAASLAATVLTLLVFVTVVSAAAYLRTAAASREVAAANDEIRRALDAEQAQRRHAETTAAEALAALDRIYDRFAPSRIAVTPEVEVDTAGEESIIEVPVQPVLSREAAPFLEELLVFYERLAERSSDYPQLRAQAANASHRIGDIRQRLGQPEQAAAAYQRAVHLYEQQPGAAEASLRLARSCNELGRVRRALRDRDAERAAHAQALNALLGVPAELTDRPEYRYELARTCYFQARHEGPPRPGGSFTGDSPRGPGRGGPDGRPPPPRGPGRGWGRDNGLVARAVGLLEPLVKEFPAVPDYRHLLACVYRDLTPRPFGWGGREGSVRHEQAVALLRELVQDFPDVPDYRYDLAEALGRIEMPRPGAGAATGEANRARLEEAVAVARALAFEEPRASHHAILHAQLQDRLGSMLFYQGKHQEAEAVLRKALAFQADVLKEHPDVPLLDVWTASLESSLARVCMARREWAEAKTLCLAATARQEHLLKEDSELFFVRGQLGRTYRMLSEVHTRLGDKDEAGKAQRRAEELSPGPRPGFPGPRDRGGRPTPRTRQQ